MFHESDNAMRQGVVTPGL